MYSRRLIFALTIAALGVAMTSAPTLAGIPSPATSTVDPCVHICPAGDMNFHVVVRDALSNPVPGSMVVVDFSPCPGVVLCPLIGSDPYTVSPPLMVIMIADAAGIADIPIRAGGTCGGPINIFADAILLASIAAITSPDQNGDAIVDVTDQGILAVKLGGPYDPTADINCNTTMGSDDATALNRHLGHSCSAVVPVWPRSWGSIKTIYR